MRYETTACYLKICSSACLSFFHDSLFSIIKMYVQSGFIEFCFTLRSHVLLSRDQHCVGLRSIAKIQRNSKPTLSIIYFQCLQLQHTQQRQQHISLLTTKQLLSACENVQSNRVLLKQCDQPLRDIASVGGKRTGSSTTVCCCSSHPKTRRCSQRAQAGMAGGGPDPFSLSPIEGEDRQPVLFEPDAVSSFQ